MCFFAKSDHVKIATKPIKVYKRLHSNNSAPSTGFIYHKGLNKPDCQHKYRERSIYGEGWLHSFKSNLKSLKLKTMFIPKGAEYKDDGMWSSENHIISSELYWPKNIFDYLLWTIKSI